MVAVGRVSVCRMTCIVANRQNFVSEMELDCLTVREGPSFYIRDLVVPSAGLAYVTDLI